MASVVTYSGDRRSGCFPPGYGSDPPRIDHDAIHHGPRQIGHAAFGGGSRRHRRRPLGARPCWLAHGGFGAHRHSRRLCRRTSGCAHGACARMVCGLLGRGRTVFRPPCTVSVAILSLFDLFTKRQVDLFRNRRSLLVLRACGAHHDALAGPVGTLAGSAAAGASRCLRSRRPRRHALVVHPIAPRPGGESAWVGPAVIPDHDPLRRTPCHVCT